MPDPAQTLPDLDLATFRASAVHGLPPVAHLGQALADRVWKRLYAHYRLLRQWAPTVNLIGRGSIPETPQRHYGESLAGLEFLGDGPCLDIGSGAGFPGLVLAACRPGQDFVLVEARQRKAAFLRRAAREMGLERGTVLASRWGEQGPEDTHGRSAVQELGPFAALTARAVDLEPWLDSLDTVLSSDAVWLAWGAGAEPRSDHSAWQRIARVTFIGDRGLTVYRRITPEKSAPA